MDDGWSKPRCVQSCPTGALQVRFAEPEEMERIAASEQLEVLQPELQTQPRVYYKNLYRFSQCFIGGSVAAEAHGMLDCAMGAAVALYQGQQKLAETTTDNYGDFKFDRLAKNTGGYSVVIQMDGWGHKEIQVPELQSSVTLGTACFRAAAGAAPGTTNS
jgi:hypothetical protein